MYLDAVKTVNTESTGGVFANQTEVAEVFDKWKTWQASEISHHGKMCCEMAREWLTSTDFSETGGSIYAGPRWLRWKFNWGASSFPIYWCEAMRKKTLDCGALGALAHEIFNVRGVTAHRAQMVQRFSEAATNQWARSWNDDSEPLPWTNRDLIYHEGCAVDFPDGTTKIWDASAGWWIDPNSKDGYGALLAIRLSGFGLAADAKLVWGKHELNAFQWTKIN